MKIHLYILLFAVLFCACSDETVVTGSKEGVISITGVISRSLEADLTLPGSEKDYEVSTLRVMAFDKDDNNKCKSNKFYFGAAISGTILHPIKIGDYIFVFLANEPATSTAELETVSIYDNLNNIAFPENAFTSELFIPMMQEADVEVLANGSAKYDGTTVSEVELKLNRLAVRVDVILKSTENLDDLFKGVIFSNIPNEVPLMPYAYQGQRTTERTFLIDSDPDYFESASPSGGYGIKWEKHIKRIVLPANEFVYTDDASKAIDFTVLVYETYNPSCKLKMSSNPDNYTLPKNSRLELTATIGMPFEIESMEVMQWGPVNNDWKTTEIRTLNVSHTSANITDFNGVRISFSSNMPTVRVLEEVDVQGGNKMETNVVFNDLAATNANGFLPTRFYYDTNTGSGYMDVLADESNPNSVRTYTLYLSAENADGTNPLIRKITVTLSQYGMRYNFNAWGDLTGYVGAFFTEDETGERIISGQHLLGKEWEAEVIDGGQWFKLSSTPSFDPNVGTNNPGDPEQYEVRPNLTKNNSDEYHKVSGRGRIYFRVGAYTKRPSDEENRYGVIALTYFTSSTNTYIQYLYLRQGKDADYVFNKNAAMKFSPYNLTASGMKNGTSESLEYEDVSPNKGEFVKYPTQAGAFFQWGTQNKEIARRAYHPARSTNSDWGYSDADADYSGLDSESEPEYWDKLYSVNETCPNGYFRPNDGVIDDIAYNGWYNSNNYNYEIDNSIIRQSLFSDPKAGNSYGQYFNYVVDEAGDKVGIQAATISAGTVVFPTFPAGTSPILGFVSRLPETNEGFYADGFFDRRPIEEVGIERGRAVSVGNANIAYRGVLFFNKDNKKSLFFPSAGRLLDTTGEIDSRSAGYYWSSSVGPWYSETNFPAWWLTLSYYNIGIGTTIKSFGCSIRCVKLDDISVSVN